MVVMLVKASAQDQEMMWYEIEMLFLPSIRLPVCLCIARWQIASDEIPLWACGHEGGTGYCSSRHSSRWPPSESVRVEVR